MKHIYCLVTCCVVWYNFHSLHYGTWLIVIKIFLLAVFGRQTTLSTLRFESKLATTLWQPILVVQLFVPM